MASRKALERPKKDATLREVESYLRAFWLRRGHNEWCRYEEDSDGE